MSSTLDLAYSMILGFFNFPALRRNIELAVETSGSLALTVPAIHVLAIIVFYYVVMAMGRYIHNTNPKDAKNLSDTERAYAMAVDKVVRTQRHAMLGTFILNYLVLMIGLFAVISLVDGEGAQAIMYTAVTVLISFYSLLVWVFVFLGVLYRYAFLVVVPRELSSGGLVLEREQEDGQRVLKLVPGTNKVVYDLLVRILNRVQFTQ